MWGNLVFNLILKKNSKKSMLILNRFIYKSFYEKEKEIVFKMSLLFKCMK